MQKARCPVCSSDVMIGDEAFESDLVTCSNCGCDLEIVTLNPPQLKELVGDPVDDLPDAEDS